MRRLFEGGVYSRAAFIRRNTVSPIGVGAVNHKNIEVNKNFLESENGKFF